MKTPFKRPLFNGFLGAALLTVAVVLGLGAVPAYAASNAIQNVTASRQGTETVVQVNLAQPLSAAPNGFVIDQPARIVLDFPGVDSALDRQTVNFEQGNLRSVNVVQAQGRTRMVLNLRQSATYKTQLDGNRLLVLLNTTHEQAAATSAATGAPQAQTVHFADNLNTHQVALRAINFKRSTDGAGRVIVNLPNNQVGVDIHQQGQNIVVDFLKTSLPADLRRRLDVTDFATPVTSITTFQMGDNVRMVIQPNGDYEQSAYQADDQFVVELRRTQPNPNALVQGNGPGFHGQKLSLNFQNIDVRSLLQVFADFTHLNVVVSDSVTGNLTLRLKDVPWDQALQVILRAKGLGERKEGNVLWIAPRDEILAREKADLEAKKSLSALEPVKSETFQLNYQKAATVVAMLTGAAGGAQSGATATPSPVLLPGLSSSAAPTSRILSPRGTVLADPRTNQIFVTDIPSKLEEVAQLIAKIDKPVRQVMIEARIVEASDQFGRSLGVKLGFLNNNLPGTGGNTPGVSVSGDYLGVSQQTGQNNATGATVTDSQFVNLPAFGLAGSLLAGATPSSLGISLFNAAANRFINLELSAMEADGKGKIISSPRVITADLSKATIEQGTEIPYQQATSSGATAVTFKKAVLSLDVTPQITPDGNVIMNVEIHKDSPGASTAGVPSINTNTVATQVQVENGGTVVLGGIYTSQEQNQTDKVPLLGDIPVLGNLFKNNSKMYNKNELMVFLTPKIVTSADLTH
ncbi:MAG: type IV pilus secretin PilQ [Thiomonas arsenitoxydans]|uniref:Type IV pilus biogenesis and competence protein PilQ n=1 Tax=Thiomonas arsenitoxydans (strain DSM 22701 / CIP 110005 / 3As) TaxID=426114 RepID=A0A8I1MVW4_THIA3|nr:MULTISPECIES: type IV pilus secretin PilQ [Thiomonas]MBN8743278.1 type IV pilus secretin PilQ [Thiomonas arsenitoxydans]ODU98842.1 MAG: secretin [Thiomonas sp. SCN 64-16]